MSTKRNTKLDQAAEAETSKTGDTNTDQMNSTEVLHQIMSRLNPLLKFNKATEMAAPDDVTLCWDVKAIRGTDTVFAHVNGSSTLSRMLTPTMMIDAPFRAEQEVTDKIIRPMVGVFQEHVNRVALEEVAVKDAGLDFDDRMEDDDLG